MELLQSRYIIMVLILIGVSILLYLAGFFKFWRNVVFDCLMDHKTGRYSINNLGRFLALFAFLFVFISVHYNITIKPSFHIQTVPFSEVEMVVILSFIIGAEVAKKLKPEPPNNQQDNG